jgi:hypothetical protein
MARSVAMTKKAVRRPAVSLKEPRKVKKPTKTLVWKDKDMMGPCDVLTVFDSESSAWPGNVAFRQLLSTYCKVYPSPTKHQQQREIAATVVQRIYEKGGSFYEKNRGVLMELSGLRARWKVQQIFQALPLLECEEHPGGAPTSTGI